jgi:uncharacterized protein YjbJ (UPF0337 family)
MAVNMQELHGQWNQLKGEIKRRWGQLTDDDLTWTGGNIDHLVGRIQQRTGETRDAIERYLNQLSSHAGTRASAMVESMGSYAQDLKHRFRDQYDRLSEQAHEGYATVHQQVGRNPFQWIAVAFGVGILTGLLIRGGGSSRSRYF